MTSPSTSIDEVSANALELGLKDVPLLDNEANKNIETEAMSTTLEVNSEATWKVYPDLQYDNATHLSLLPQTLLDETRKDDLGREQNAMINIPEHEPSPIRPKIMNLAPLSKYVSTGNYMTNTKSNLQTPFASPLNSIEYFNPIDFPQYNIQGLMDLPTSTNNSLRDNSYPDTSVITPEPARVSAYAKLIFEDGYFYMNTYSVILGRDLQAWHAAIRKEKRRQRQLQEDGSQIGDITTPVRVKNKENRYYRSTVSESGGMFRAGNDSDSEERARLRRLRKICKVGKKSNTNGFLSLTSRKTSLSQSSRVKVYEAQNLQSMISSIDDPVPVDPATFRPSPHDCPLVAIHPPAIAPISAYKSISREHVKITFNSRKCYFEAHIIGRNGCFVQDQWYHTNDVVPLKSGDFLQVGGITVQFVLPNLLDPTTVETEYSNTEPIREKSPYQESCEQQGYNHSETSDEGATSSAEKEELLNEFGDRISREEINDNIKAKANTSNKKKKKKKLSAQENIGTNEHINDDTARKVGDKIPLGLNFSERRGPGRPPKNGILSKRKQKLLKKEEQALLEVMIQDGFENSKIKEKDIGKESNFQFEPKPKLILTDTPSENSFDSSSRVLNPQQPSTYIKNKVGRPRKHPLPENSGEPPREKRKYTKRKPKDGIVSGSGSGEDGKVRKEKPPRSHRSPSPIMREEDYTAEQLAKPQANYVTLIHEALLNAPTQKLGLPDIYRAICRKYPYFKFKTQTLGWQSSVRHNLSQHHAFHKVEKDGKGWTWGIVDGISIEKEKKRRPTPPSQHQMASLLQQQQEQQSTGNYAYEPSTGDSNSQLRQFSRYQLTSFGKEQAPSVTSLPNFIPSIPLHLASSKSQISYHSPYAPKPTKSETCNQSTARDNQTQQTSLESLTHNLSSKKEETQIEELTLKSDKISSENFSSHHPVAQVHDQSEQILYHSLKVQTNQEQDVQPKIFVDVLGNHQDQKSNSSCDRSSQNQEVTQTNYINKSSMKTLPNVDVVRAAEAFKKNLLDSLKSKQSEMIVNSAVDRVLGKSPQNNSSDNPQEEIIMTTLRSLLSKIQGSVIEPDTKSLPPSQPNTQTSEVSNSSYQSGAHSVQTSTKSTDLDEVAIAVARPTFTAQGQSRLSISVVPRPSIINSGSKIFSSEITGQSVRPKGDLSPSRAPTSNSIN